MRGRASRREERNQYTRIRIYNEVARFALLHSVSVGDSWLVREKMAVVGRRAKVVRIREGWGVEGGGSVESAKDGERGREAKGKGRRRWSKRKAQRRGGGAVVS